MAKRQCKGTNRAGESCKAAPMKDSDYCSAHNPLLPDSTRFGSPTQSLAAGLVGGRPRRPREIELIQEVADEFQDDLRAVYSEGLTATRAVVVGIDQAEIRMVPDHQHRLKTAQEIQDRLHGKPRSNDDTGPSVAVNFNLITDDDLRDRAADLRRRLADRRAIQSSGTDARD